MNVYEIFFYYFLSTFLVFSLVIFVHEMGHFLAARSCNIPVKVFSIGFGREIFGYTDKKGTRWKLALIPLGGYITTDESDKTPLGKRAFVTIAGPAMNIIFSIVLMMAVLSIWGMSRAPLEVVGVVSGAGADKANIQIGDVLTVVDGVRLPTDSNAIQDIIAKSSRDVIDVEIIRDGQTIHKKVVVTQTADEDDFGKQISRKRMGVLLAGSNINLKGINTIEGVDVRKNTDLVRKTIIQNFDRQIVMNYGEGVFAEDVRILPRSAYNQDLKTQGSRFYKTLVMWDKKKRFYEPVPFITACQETAELVGRATKITIGVIYQLITGKKKTGDVGGVVQMGEMTGDITSQSVNEGPSVLLSMIVILSIQIGLLNLLPFPMLDGGHLLFHAYEAVFKKQPSLRVKGYMYGVSIVLLLWVIIVANVSDLLKLLE